MARRPGRRHRAQGRASPPCAPRSIPARAAADAARGDEEGYRTQVDAVALSTFESGRLDTFNALLASGSPQDYLDQMSALEMISSDQAAALDALTTVVERTRRAQDDADAAAARAQTAADDAAPRRAGARRPASATPTGCVDEAEALLRRLTPRERRERHRARASTPRRRRRARAPGSARCGRRPRSWARPTSGAPPGPRRFDCSGLTSFSFRQAGITLPRSSSQQARVGRPVAFDDLQPGDLVFFYNPVSHVGIYAGDGKLINAPAVRRRRALPDRVTARTFSGARRL